MFRKNGQPMVMPDMEPAERIDERVYCTERGELCESCPYPGHGFICWSEDGRCMRLEVINIMERSRKNG